MKKTNKKELFWGLGVTVFILCFNFGFLGLDSLSKNSTTDINIHDTYFVISKFYFFILFAVSIFFWVYLARMLRNSFKNLTVNVVFMVAEILMVIMNIYALLFLNVLGDNTEKAQNVLASDPVSEFMNIMFYAVLTLQLFLLVFLAYCGFKTGVQYQKNK